MARVANKIALVTGAASHSGIGKAIAALLASEGATVILTDIDVAAGELAAAEVGHGAVFQQHDVRDDSSWESLVSMAQSRFGKLDILVNNAGITGGTAAQDIESTTLSAWREVQAVNVEGLVLGCKWAIAAMKNGGGSIVNISSMAALVGTPSLPAYGASKAAVRQITQTVALHCARRHYRIRCNSIHPGIIDTEILDGAFAPDVLERLRSTIPSGEFGLPGDVALAALYLASDESRYVTGTRLIVDGGVTMQ